MQMMVALVISIILAILYFSGLVPLELGSPEQESNSSTDLIKYFQGLFAFVMAGGAAVWAFVSASSKSLAPGTPDAAKNYSMGSGDPLKRLRKHFSKIMRRVHRPVLVVIDDLDRCDAKFVVELVRGMQTVFKSRRVVYLLLGDRDWIEQCFADVHKAMKGIDVGPEHEFGSRFVEKAIQFSFVLPEINPADRERYLRGVLGLSESAALNGEGANPQYQELQKSLEEGMSAVRDSVSVTEKNRLADDLKQQLKTSFAELPNLEVLVDRQVDREVVLSSAASESSTRQTRHLLQGLSVVMPPNPRQIKRIINTITLVEGIAQMQEGVRKGDAKWKQMTLWIILMIEWPKTWYTLSTDPELEKLKASSGGDDNTLISKILSVQSDDPMAKKIRQNQQVMDLLVLVTSEETWQGIGIDAQALKWLTRIMPASSGEALEMPKKEIDGNSANNPG